MEENAVEIIARFFGRDRETSAIDQFCQSFRRQLKARRKIALDDHREIIARQSGQFEAAAPGLDLHPVIGCI